ncbi:MAG: peptidase C1, partial [Calditrichia bacterium]|nr:peptidase C1 [Calditrichia bacterium]
DIPSEYINEDARQFRFSNETTTDDHGIHCVGWMEKEGKDWYLIKDSGSGSKNGNNWGFYFYHEDYVKLKMMNILVHKEAAKDILKKIKK